MSDLGVNVVHTVEFPSGVKLIAAQGSVVHFSGDAIVNAANCGGLGGGGVDGAICQVSADRGRSQLRDNALQPLTGWRRGAGKSKGGVAYH